MAVYYNDEGDLKLLAGSTMYADNPIGSILPFGGTKAPNGWFLCQGQALSRTEYSDLFKAIGTSFGAGDGSTTFNIPDLRGEFLRGAGTNSHSGQGNGSAVGTHQDATNHIALTPWTQQLYFEIGAVPTYYDYAKNGPTYQYLQNEAGHTGPQDVSSTYTSRPTNTSVNYIIKAKQVAVPFNVAEYVRNQNVLSEYEIINLSSAVTAQYDGYLAVKAVGGAKEIYINGSSVATAAPSSSSMDASGSVAFRKGDVLSVSSYYANSCKACYYKLRDYSGR